MKKVENLSLSLISIDGWSLSPPPPSRFSLWSIYETQRRYHRPSALSTTATPGDKKRTRRWGRGTTKEKAAQCRREGWWKKNIGKEKEGRGQSGCEMKTQTRGRFIPPITQRLLRRTLKLSRQNTTLKLDP